MKWHPRRPLTLPGRIVRPTLPAGSWNTLHAAGRVNEEWKASLFWLEA